jgi:anion-transporting  ArsA/GET3 family ATPase
MNASFLKSNLLSKRCILVCGGGGVGKTTMAAALALAATQVRSRVLVVTIDPAKRLAEAFGYSMQELEGGQPKLLSPEVAAALGVPTTSSLSVGLLNPKYVLNEILQNVLNADQRQKLAQTLLYSQLSEMIYGLQEYTAYEWVTRMLNENQYDLIVLDTPPAFHAKDFFTAPEKIMRLMESKVFQLFSPKKSSWMGTILSSGFVTQSFGWIEKLLGARIYQESHVFFETFVSMRDRILSRCQNLSQFFSNQEVEVITVTTPESSALHELEGLIRFLNGRTIPVHTIVVNQMEPPVSSAEDLELQADLSEELKVKLNQLIQFRQKKYQHGLQVLSILKETHASIEILPIQTSYAGGNGFDLLRSIRDQIPT